MVFTHVSVDCFLRVRWVTLTMNYGTDVDVIPVRDSNKKVTMANDKGKQKLQ